MGNCQAAEAATVIIQHPGGKVERLYWTATAEEVMKNNPGHYVALVIHCVDSEKEKEKKQDGARVTRVKLLKPKDLLLLGQVYRLIASQEVTKALQARKYEKLKKIESDLTNEKQDQREKQRDHHGKVYVVQRRHNDSKQSNQVRKQERENRYRSSSSSGTSGSQQSNKGRQWRPSLNSISEAMN